MQPQKTSTTGSGTIHNIKEKVLHPFTHDTDSNITYESRQQKKLAETDPNLASQFGVKDVGIPHKPATTTGVNVPQSTTTSGGMLNQPTQTNIAREEYMEKKL
ncbi:predicted protein [Naegleria gruberi]|uniref:Predicted protein n=1 Tax=Naegleria gruberi TaxID=5762 RepID=D2VDX8_NAEGR|nr:uncharacterized protein NAEGRDRAFT_67079 [Naegleria gruberi]EFC45075.1 predicted protein [Naegleria gruberi]|eukprot:XP_002677819.1 predicted protein [Naegleria gruberi strain NEG-M]